ncbi:MAG: hypothetical protein ACK5OC_11275, partial [Pirellula sp.]
KLPWMQSWQRSSLPRNKNNLSKCLNEADQWVAPVGKLDDLKAEDAGQADLKAIDPRDKDVDRADLKVIDQKVIDQKVIDQKEGDVAQADLRVKDANQGDQSDHSLSAILSAIAAISGFVLVFYLKLNRTTRLAISVLGTIIVLFAIRIAMG